VSTLADLIQLRLTAKKHEDEAVAHRRLIDGRIAELMRDPAKTEGSVSRVDGEHKVSVTYGITRKADTTALQNNWAELPAAVQDVFKFEADVRVCELKKLAAADALIAAKYIESKPSTPSVKLEPVA